MPVVKGGVWTNVEDEILKASVSKYGLNQWQRVSSLLARKSAKQCKARWNEWLDPSIRKVEFSREEDEKLLHMAKLFPTQWRTIARVVGRTATQCLDRYQKLLDEAEAKEGEDLSLGGPEGGETAAPAGDDVRKFRPGETDPDPETKPARPDAVDMDEDEKEMLSEARARLANTQGKKAKRKARERLLEESRRLAVLQKRRELKHAGISIKLVNRKKGEMDYNADIPFERKPALGFYDIAEEEDRNEQQRANFDPRRAQTNAKRRGEQDEDGNDRKRKKGDKTGSAAQFASAAKAGQMQKIREAEQLSKRRALSLPEPQVGEAELEDIVKMGIMGKSANELARASENESTMGLVGDYSRIGTGITARTPMAAPEEDRIANEIKNIRALTETQSSLLGGENTPLVSSGAGTTGFDGIAPRRSVIATPNPLLTPMHSSAGGPAPGLTGATPRAAGPGATPMRAPRDTLAINATGQHRSQLVAMTPRDVKQRELATKSQLKAGFASLPAPKMNEEDFEFELADENEEEAQGVGEVTEEDAAERDRRERERVEEEERRELARRTSVLKRGLPRPREVDVSALVAYAEEEEEEDPVKKMIAVEAAKLVGNDALRYPVLGGKVKGTASKLDKVDDEFMEKARMEILMELPAEALADLQTEFEKEWVKTHTSTRIPGLADYDDDTLDVESVTEKLKNSVLTTLTNSALSANKLESKLKLHFGGYQKRATLLRTKLLEAHTAICDTRRELEGYRTLAISEQDAIPRRLEKLEAEVRVVEGRERELQGVYGRLREEREGVVERARGRGIVV